MAEEVNSGAQENKGAPEEQEEMSKIIADLRRKMAEIDKITEELEKKRKQTETGSPQKTQRILEEIKVPPLELLR